MEPYVLGREEGEAIWMFDALDTIKADAEGTAAVYGRVPHFEGSSVPVHVNDHARTRKGMRNRARRERAPRL
jgi:hypothetical protein